MNRIGAAFYERGNAVQPAVTTDAKRRSRQKAHRAQRRNVGKIGMLELFVVGNIEEYALLFRLRHSNGAKRPPDPKILIEELASASGLYEPTCNGRSGA